MVQRICVSTSPQQGGGAVTERTTTPYMTKYERARILGTRALQISMNAPVLVGQRDLHLRRSHRDHVEIARGDRAWRSIAEAARRDTPRCLAWTSSLPGRRSASSIKSRRLVIPAKLGRWLPNKEGVIAPRPYSGGHA